MSFFYNIQKNNQKREKLILIVNFEPNSYRKNFANITRINAVHDKLYDRR